MGPPTQPPCRVLHLQGPTFSISGSPKPEVKICHLRGPKRLFMGPWIQISFVLNFHCSKRLFQDGYHGCSCSNQRKKGKKWRYVCTFSLNCTANNKAIVFRSSRNRLCVKELLQNDAFCLVCAERRFSKQNRI